MSAAAQTDTDREIYELLQRCREAGLPVTFCGDDLNRRWSLITLLRTELRKAADLPKNVDDAGASYTVYPAE